MATLVGIGYADQRVAEDAKKFVGELEDELSVRTHQVASVSRDIEGRYHVHTSHSGDPGLGRASWSGLWDPLFGLLFSIPVVGVAPSADLRTILGHLTETAAAEAFLDRIREQVKPGTSALFIAVEHGTPEGALQALEHYGGTVIETSLSNEELERCRKALGPAMSAKAR